MKPDYDTTVARIAGNIASGIAVSYVNPADKLIPTERVAADAVELARAIVAEVKRTAPVDQTQITELKGVPR